jgi:hypothetical protein
MGQTINGRIVTDGSSPVPSDANMTNGGFPASLPGIQAAQLQDWQAQMALRGYPPNVQPSDIKTSVGAPVPTPTNVIANPGKAVEPPNAQVPLMKKSDGSVAGRLQGTSVVFNLPAPNPSQSSK